MNIIETSSGITEAFIEFLDSLFYQGYAERIAAENPQLYLFEYEFFLENYSF
ncbi:MAG: hypothetical protein JKY48_13785 [Flavobacteriales bacterium]|nr:hypothetical protein [Flavobacteriales bacterium]